MAIKLGFFKSEQGSFGHAEIERIKQQIIERLNCELVEVDFRRGFVINGKVYVDDICLNDLDMYFWHDTIRPANWQSDNYYLNLLKALECDVVVVNDAPSTELVNDKYLAHTKLSGAGIPVSSFALVNTQDTSAVARIVSEFGGDVLVKPRFGGWGAGIVRAKSASELRSIIELCSSFASGDTQVLVERYHENDLHGWISVVMVGNKPLYCYKKPVVDGEWKVYDPDKLDGKGQNSILTKAPEEVLRIATKAAEVLGRDIVGFDFIDTPTGYLIVDENSRPGIYGHLLDEANVDFVGAISDMVVEKAVNSGLGAA